MMHDAFVFLLLFGCLLIFAAAALCLNRDPRESVFFARVQGKLTKEEARRTARQIAAAVAGVGLRVDLPDTNRRPDFSSVNPRFPYPLRHTVRR